MKGPDLLAVVGMIFTSVAILVFRYLSNIYHGVRNLVHFTSGFILILPWAVGLDKMTIPDCQSSDVAFILVYGVTLSFSNTFFAWALTNDEIGRVALVRVSEYGLGYLWQLTLLQDYPVYYSVFGVPLVCSGIFVALTQKWLKTRDEQSKWIEYFSWLL